MYSNYLVNSVKHRFCKQTNKKVKWYLDVRHTIATTKKATVSCHRTTSMTNTSGLAHKHGYILRGIKTRSKRMIKSTIARLVLQQSPPNTGTVRSSTWRSSPFVVHICCVGNQPGDCFTVPCSSIENYAVFATLHVL